MNYPRTDVIVLATFLALCSANCNNSMVENFTDMEAHC